MSFASETILTNARIVLRDGLIEKGSVVLRDGAIAAVDDAPSALASALDLGGDYLLPGLIEMHTDNMEKHFEPRPGVLWPNTLAAAVCHDTQIIGAGITTVFDAVAVGAYETKPLRHRLLGDTVAAIKHAQSQGMLRAEHLFHLRCELNDPCVLELFEPYAADPLVKLVSLMDHTPGQRQFTDVAKYVQYSQGESWTEAELADRLARMRERQEQFADPHRARIVEIARDRGLTLASHDDATEDHVLQSVAEGCAIAEFPITATAATLARQHGQATIMGAPNVVRGGSHSGNVSARDLARQGVLSGLSSDYVPYSLLQAAFLLEDEGIMPLHGAVACVSANIAAMAGLEDRGRIAPGLRGDVVRVHYREDTPVVRHVWRGGERVY